MPPRFLQGNDWNETTLHTDSDPMKNLHAIVLLASSAAALAEPPATVPTGEFSKQQISKHFWAEGASFGDFNKDGKMDVVYGPYWWEGPDFLKRHTYSDDSKTSTIKKDDGTTEAIPGFKGALSNENDYSKNFLAYTHDFNADGWTDILILGFPGEQSWWYENPKGKEGLWTQHVAID